MKKSILLNLAAFLFIAAVGAQNANSNMALGTYIENDQLPAAARSIMESKLQQIASANGINDVSYYPRFILTPNISVMSKNILPTAPPQVVLNLDVALYIGDGQSGTLYSSKNFSVKGVGRNETKAYIAALKNISPQNSEVQNFIAEGKQKIIDFYNTNCEVIQKEVSSLKNQQRYEEAMAMLVNVPVNSNCFDKVGGELKRLYQMAIDRQCQRSLASATAIWSANQDLAAANEAGAILANIDPNAKCYKDVKTLFGKIEKRAKEVSDRPWEYKLKVLDAKISAAEGAMEIMKLYVKNQPQAIAYNIRGWF
ncbi:MAG TPA: hypothetical protein VFM72_04525 [Aequorivita sp.]|nr:hypothetical protein [Aequorivita sp.]